MAPLLYLLLGLASAASCGTDAPAPPEAPSALGQLSSAGVPAEPPAMPPAVQVAPAGAPGLELEKSLSPVPELGIRLANILDIDPARYRIRTVSARHLLGKTLATLPEVMAAVPGAVAGVNAGFFSRKDGTLIGDFVEDGKPAAHEDHPSMDRVFYATSKGAVGIVHGTKPPEKDVVSAASGKSQWEVTDRTARNALCLTPGGYVRLVSAYPVESIAAMDKYLHGKAGCSDAVHLDGGGSTQLMVRGQGGLTIGWERRKECTSGERHSPKQCFRAVPTFLLVVPK